MTDVSDANRFAPPRAAVADLHPVADGPQLAERGERLFAAIIDSLLMMAISLPIFFGFMGGMSLYGSGEESPSTWSVLAGDGSVLAASVSEAQAHQLAVHGGATAAAVPSTDRVPAMAI